MTIIRRLKENAHVVLLILSLTWSVRSGNAPVQVSKRDIEDVMDLMQKADVNAAGPNDTNFNYQHASSEGVAPEKFVSFIATEYLKKPTVTAFLSLMNSFEPQVGTPERTGKQKKRKIGKFLDELLKTEVMNLLQEFLQRFKLFPTASHQNFKKFLEDLWFTEYARRGSVVDSSAFEHVFIGELEKGAVIGLHSWIRFAFLEETGAASYIGYKKEEHDSVAKIDFTWNNKRKKQSSMLLGSSPEFDMAAATICSLVYPGSGKCKFFYRNCPVSFVSHYITWKGRQYLSTCFPKTYAACRTLATNLTETNLKRKAQVLPNNS